MSEKLIEQARAFVDAQNPFVKGQSEIVMRKGWLLEMLANFALSVNGWTAVEDVNSLPNYPVLWQAKTGYRIIGRYDDGVVEVDDYATPLSKFVAYMSIPPYEPQEKR